jgi:putative DNA primase/helicase
MEDMIKPRHTGASDTAGDADCAPLPAKPDLVVRPNETNTARDLAGLAQGRDDDELREELDGARRYCKPRDAASDPAATNDNGRAGRGDSGEDTEPLPPEFSEEALTLHFAERHADDLRNVAAWAKWFAWVKYCWRQDDTLFAFHLARRVCREAAKEAKNRGRDKLAPQLASAKTAAAVEKLAKADRRLAATVHQWDTDPLALNKPAGLVDLRTGTMSPSTPSAYCTKATAVAPGGACPIWRAVLDRVFGGDPELVAFFQRVAGYSLTGITTEHAMFFSHGTGANGKGVTHNTLTRIFGDYAVVASMETFTASAVERHPTDLAMLRGARLVTAQETEEGKHWAEAKIKAMTGGDPITARYMRQDFFTFIPQFKLLIAGNHKPGLRGVDEAIRRRLHLIPFVVAIPPDERDPRLSEKLKAEGPGILAWAIEGCLQWQRVGLAPPAAVRDATAKYLDAEDAFNLWLEECCERDPNSWTSSTILYKAWKEWAERAGEFIGSQRRFVATLETKGFAPRRRSTGRGFDGIRLIRAEKP